MSIQRAFNDMNCENCGVKIEAGDPIYFDEGGKICELCAEDAEIVCQCGSQKKPDFGKCYDCHNKKAVGLELSIGDTPIDFPS